MLLKRVGADINILKDPLALLFAMGWHRRLFGGKLVKIISHDHDCRKLKYNIPYILYWLGARFLDFTVFQSDCQKSNCWKNLRLRGQVIKNMVDNNTITKKNNKKRDISALWIGSALERKRPHLLLDIAERLPDVLFTMIIAPGLNYNFNRSIKERALSIRNVNYLGFVEHSKIQEYYDRAKILVNTSGAEGFPNIYLEAWKSGVPVVSFEIDPDQVIVKNELGRVSIDLESYTKNIRDLLNNNALRKKLGENGKKYIQKKHGTESIVSQYVALFKNLMMENYKNTSKCLYN
jgi:glycosyltransferase involved in cell wall biosynthesis